MNIRPALPHAVMIIAGAFLGCHAPRTSSPDGSLPPVDAGSAMPADVTLTWSEASPCPLPRFEAQSAVVGGRLYVMGGFTSNTLSVTSSVQSYDPVADSWRQEMDLPGAQTHMGVVVNGSEIWLIGGFVGAATGWTPTQVVWSQADPMSPWQQAASLPSPRAALAAVLLGTQLHAVGGLASDGTSDSAAHTVLDLSQPTSWTDAPAVPNPRNHLGGAAVNGQLVIVGGRHGWDEQMGNQDSVDSYDPATQAWSSLAPIPLGRSEINASTFASGNQVIVIGGEIDPVTPSSDVFAYDSSTAAWLRLPSLPAPRKGAVAAAIGNRIVVTTGSPDGTDPIGTTWVGCCLSP